MKNTSNRQKSSGNQMTATEAPVRAIETVQLSGGIAECSPVPQQKSYDVIGVEPTAMGGLRLWLSPIGERILMFVLIIIFL
jgi:hypothetical protein